MRTNKVFVNFRMVISILLLMLIVTLASCFLAYLIEIGVISTKTETDRIGCRNIMIILAILFNIVMICVAVPKWFTQIEFTFNGIYQYIPFCNKNFFEYSCFRQITYATYNHIGVFPKYIVFSPRRLSNYEKTHINLNNDSKLIVLRCTPKVLHMLNKFNVSIDN